MLPYKAVPMAFDILKYFPFIQVNDFSYDRTPFFATVNLLRGMIFIRIDIQDFCLLLYSGTFNSSSIINS